MKSLIALDSLAKSSLTVVSVGAFVAHTFEYMAGALPPFVVERP